MPTKASNRPLLKPGKRLQHIAWVFSGWRSAAIGVLAAVITVGSGRQFLKVTTSTLSGWTALFFLAVFFGLITANSVDQRRFLSPLQLAAISCGVLSSVISLVLLDRPTTTTGATALVVACAMFILTMITGFKYRSPKPTTFNDQSLKHWAVRLDDLLKYDLDRTAKAALVTLIETLWNSPKDQEYFIPAQSQSFEKTLNALEEAVRRQDAISIDKNLDSLAGYLAVRNQLINATVNVSYRQLGSDTAMLHEESTRF